MLFCVCPFLVASNPATVLSDYAHRAWPLREISLKTNVATITQTADGYLWFGTSFGIVRFDGVQMVSWSPPAGQQLPNPAAWAVLAARDGSLWIGTAGGLANWKNGSLTEYPALSGQRVVALLEDQEGIVWAGTIGSHTGRLCAIRGAITTCYGDDGSLGDWVISLYEDKGGRLWAGTTSGVWRWKPGPPVRYLREPITAPHVFAEAESGGGVTLAAGKLWQISGEHVTDYPLPGVSSPMSSSRLLRDRKGALWIGTQGHGIVHVFRDKVSLFTHSNGLSGDTVSTLFEDREGNIWVATTDGIDRFRESPVGSVSVKDGLSSATATSVLAGGDGSLWIGTVDGLNRWRDGHMTVYRNPTDSQAGSIFEDKSGRVWVSGSRSLGVLEDGRLKPAPFSLQGRASAIAGDAQGGLWLTSPDYGLVHLAGGKVIEHMSFPQPGEAGSGLIPEPDGGVWVGLFNGGVIYFRNGQIRRKFSGSDGLGSGKVANIYRDRDGAIWASTENGLSRIADGRVVTLSTKNGLPCNTVHWVIEDNLSSYWLYTQCGLIGITRREMDAWTADNARKIQTSIFDNSDGVRLLAMIRPERPQVTKSSDGKIWFAHWGTGTVNTFDPARVNRNTIPPPVHIEQIVADDKIYFAKRGVHVHPRVRNLTIDYTALSFVEPGKVHFRYKLDGQDPDWREVINHREVQYSNLAPANYRFRVIASNNDGVWNQEGDTLDFTIDPAAYQTAWFRALAVCAVLGILVVMYRYRLYQLNREYNVRVEERTRIARDLHDTLLQTFQGLMLRFQVVDDLLPPGKAKEELEATLECGDQAVTEARDAVRDLRSYTATGNDLSQALREAANDLTRETTARFRFLVEGEARDLEPMVRDEIYRIAREALRNAAAHSGANLIEVELIYNEPLMLRVRDHGKGIPREFLEDGRGGHYGLAGMRERAEAIGAELLIRGGKGVGTEIELSVPAHVAYAKQQRRPGWWPVRGTRG
jgi:signal transduction histidine kinase/ligand-binding sensor domain-containing protein